MGEHIRNQEQRSRIKLSRGADGRLRSADDIDIADIWADQRRIRLAEAISEDAKKAARKGKGFKAFARKKTVATPRPSGKPKEVAITITLPKLKVPKLKLPNVSVKRLTTKIPKKYLLAAVGAIVVVTLGAASFSLYGNNAKDGAGAKSEVLDAHATTPEYDTLLPEGKTIEDLGGWARVSPPDRNPVFAFADTIEGAVINVSEQPLPEGLKQAAELEKMAKGFSANEKITAGDVTAYLGTSTKGPQSLIVAKDDLLILIKSTTKLTNQQWTDYVTTLH